MIGSSDAVNATCSARDRRAADLVARDMDPGPCCPYCLEAGSRCPHLLIYGGQHGEVLGGGLAERLRAHWAIIVVNVGDDPVLDARGVYAETWRNLLQRYAAEGDLAIEENGSTAIFVENATGMATVVERCIPGDDL